MNSDILRLQHTSRELKISSNFENAARRLLACGRGGRRKHEMEQARCGRLTRSWTSIVARLPFWRLMLYGAAASLLFFAGSLALGFSQGRVWPTLSLIGTSIVLEAQPAAAASIPLGFDPPTGAGISILANMIAVPILMLGFRQVMHRFRFVRRRMEKAEALSRKYGKYGVWVLAPLCPLLGAYACLAIGSILRWHPLRVLAAVVVGMVGSAFVIAYGGFALLRLFHS